MRTTRFTLTAALATALVLGACGDDDGGDAGGGGGSDDALAVDANEGIDGVQAIRVEGNEHSQGEVDYELRPPAGGTHNPTWVNCGFYDEPFDDEHLVHDLEHGAVWLAYAPDLPVADVDVIHELARDHKVVATPYEDLDAGVAVVASAWARQLTLDSVDDPRLQDFVVQYEDGSQAPEAGVTCGDSPLGDPIP
jgi:hypothetical protein